VTTALKEERMPSPIIDKTRRLWHIHVMPLLIGSNLATKDFA
jgi:hypothetical protein